MEDYEVILEETVHHVSSKSMVQAILLAQSEALKDGFKCTKVEKVISPSGVTHYCKSCGAKEVRSKPYCLNCENLISYGCKG